MPHSRAKIRQYRRKMEQIRRQVGNLNQAAARRTVRLLRRQRSDVLSQFSLIPTEDGSWQAHHLAQLLRATQDQLGVFRDEYGDLLEQGQLDSIRLGEEKVNFALRHFDDREMAGFGLSTERIELAQDFAATLVTDVGDRMTAAISSELQRGIMGGASPHEIMKRIGGSNGLLQDPSVFRSSMVRAETITRTEMGRMLSMSTQNSMEQAAEQDELIFKQWITSGDDRVRDEHAAADGQIVPVDQPFIVGGEDLMMPNDPGGSPENTINCRCDMVSVKADWLDDAELDRLRAAGKLPDGFRREAETDEGQ